MLSFGCFFSSWGAGSAREPWKPRLIAPRLGLLISGIADLKSTLRLLLAALVSRI